MKIEKIFLTIAIISVVLAVPIGNVLSQRVKALKFEKSNNNQLQLDIKTIQEQLDDQEKANQKLKSENKTLDKKLQAKLERQERERQLALAKPAPVNRMANVPSGCEAYRPLVAKYSWNVEIAMAVMRAESTQNNIPCNPNAANWNDTHRDIYGNVVCTGSFGLFQISCHGGQIYDPAANIAAAWAKYEARGWQPWGAYTNGSYLAYLN